MYTTSNCGVLSFVACSLLKNLVSHYKIFLVNGLVKEKGLNLQRNQQISNLSDDPDLIVKVDIKKFGKDKFMSVVSINILCLIFNL